MSLLLHTWLETRIEDSFHLPRPRFANFLGSQCLLLPSPLHGARCCSSLAHVVLSTAGCHPPFAPATHRCMPPHIHWVKLWGSWKDLSRPLGTGWEGRWAVPKILRLPVSPHRPRALGSWAQGPWSFGPCAQGPWALGPSAWAQGHMRLELLLAAAFNAACCPLPPALVHVALTTAGRFPSFDPATHSAPHTCFQVGEGCIDWHS